MDIVLDAKRNLAMSLQQCIWMHFHYSLGSVTLRNTDGEQGSDYTIRIAFTLFRINFGIHYKDKMHETEKWSLSLEVIRAFLAIISILFMILGMSCLCCSICCSSNSTPPVDRTWGNEKGKRKSIHLTKPIRKSDHDQEPRGKILSTKQKNNTRSMRPESNRCHQSRR